MFYRPMSKILSQIIRGRMLHSIAMSMSTILNDTNHRKYRMYHCSAIFLSYVIRPSVMCHGSSHTNGVYINGRLHMWYIVFVWSLVRGFTASRDPYLNLASAIIQWGLSPALLWHTVSGPGRCCPFRDRAPVNFIHGCHIFGYAALTCLWHGVPVWWRRLHHIWNANMADFILGINPVMVFRAWPICEEITCYLGNNTMISSLSIERQL